MQQTPLELKIDGMHCDACVRRVTTALSGIPGVALQQVEIGKAIMTYDAGESNPPLIEQAIQDIGFEATSQ